MTHEGRKNWETWNTASWCDKDELIHWDRMRRRPRTAEECEAFVRDWFPNGTPPDIVRECIGRLLEEARETLRPIPILRR